MESRIKSFQTNKISVDIVSPSEAHVINIIGGAPNVKGLATNTGKSVSILQDEEPQRDQVLTAKGDDCAAWEDTIPLVGLVDPMPQHISTEKVKEYLEPHQIEVNPQGLTNPMMNVAPLWRKVDFDDFSEEIDLSFESETYLKSLGDVCYLSINVAPIATLTKIKQFCLSMKDFPHVEKSQSGIVSITLDSGPSLICEATLDDEMLYVSVPQELPKDTCFSLQGNIVFLKK